MPTISLPQEEIPHGHGLSFKRGVSDGILGLNQYSSEIHPTHSQSYSRGKDIGIEIRKEVATLVQD